MLRGYRGAFVTIGLIAFASWGVGQSPENLGSDQPIEQQSTEAESAEQPTVEPEAVVEAPAAPTQPAEETHGENAGNQEDAEPERDAFQFWGDTWAQRAMAATGVAALFISAWAVWLLKKTLIETHRATDAAIKAAEAADASIDVSRELGQRELGAYLTIDSANYQVDRKDIYLSICLKNIGKRPAVNAVTKSTIYFLFLDERNNGREEGFPMSHEMRVGTIEPDAIQMAWGVIVSTDLPEHVRSKSPEWCIPSSIWCDVEWQDIFGNWRATKYWLKERRPNEHLLSIEPSVTTHDLTIGDVQMIGYGPDKQEDGD